MVTVIGSASILTQLLPAPNTQNVKTDDVTEMKLTNHTVPDTKLQVFWDDLPSRLAITDVSKDGSACTFSANYLPDDTA
jgi:hypothetical protein